MSLMPDFQTEPERRQWLIDNAEYFTVIRRHNRQNERSEWHTLVAAEHEAKRLLEGSPEARLMIYAVYGVHDTWVKTVQK